MNTSTIVWIIVLAVLLLLVIGLFAFVMNKRKTEHNRARAEEIRTQAVTQTGDLTEAQRRAQEAEAQAQLKRAEAERAEERAAQAKQGHVMEEAHHEDRLREADRIDPDVDHRADDYAPGSTTATPAEGTTTSGTTHTHTHDTAHESGTVPPTTDGTVPPPTEPGTHRA